MSASYGLDAGFCLPGRDKHRRTDFELETENQRLQAAQSIVESSRTKA
jgi:hypothetical protein